MREYDYDYEHEHGRTSEKSSLMGAALLFPTESQYSRTGGLLKKSCAVTVRTPVHAEIARR